MIQISPILQWGILFWGIAIFLLLLITACNIYIKTKKGKKAYALRSKLLEEITSYISTKEITPKLLTRKKERDIAIHLLLDLLEKFTGADHDYLCTLVENPSLSSWITKNLKSRNPRRLQPALLLVKHIKDKKYLPLVEKIWNHHHTLTRLLSKEVALQIAGTSIIPTVLDSFKNESPACRIYLMESITRFRNEATPFLLNALLKTEDPYTQISLIVGLEDLFAIPTSDHLLELLKKSNNEGVQFAILNFFSDIPLPIPTNLLPQFLKHPSVIIRRMALIASLCQETDKGIMRSILENTINDDSWQIRYLSLHRWVSYFKEEKPPAKDHHLYERVLAEESIGLKAFGEGLERPPLC